MSEGHDESAFGGDSPPPPSPPTPEPPPESTAVRSGGEDGVPEASTAETPVGGEVLVDPKGESVGDLGPEKGARVVVDVGDWELEPEKVCRICHLSPEHGGLEETELIQLGCGCKGELGLGHRDCAETWFRMKGNRSCEICGMNAKNIIGEEDRSFMEECHEGITLGGINNRNLSESRGCWKSQPLCNFLMACLVVAFIFPWFCRINMF